MTVKWCSGCLNDIMVKVTLIQYLSSNRYRIFIVKLLNLPGLLSYEMQYMVISRNTVPHNSTRELLSLNCNVACWSALPIFICISPFPNNRFHLLWNQLSHVLYVSELMWPLILCNQVIINHNDIHDVELGMIQKQSIVSIPHFLYQFTFMVSFL